jgi:hypothetical protein
MKCHLNLIIRPPGSMIIDTNYNVNDLDRILSISSKSSAERQAG